MTDYNTPPREPSVEIVRQFLRQKTQHASLLDDGDKLAAKAKYGELIGHARASLTSRCREAQQYYNSLAKTWRGLDPSPDVRALIDEQMGEIAFI